MGAPTDIGEQTGSMAKAALFGGFLGWTRVEENIGPVAELEFVLGRPCITTGEIPAGREKRIGLLLALLQLGKQKALADAEDRDDHGFRPGKGKNALENHGAKGQGVGPAARYEANILERCRREAGDEIGDRAGSLARHAVMMKHIQRIV